MPRSHINLQPSSSSPRLFIRTRRTGEIIICDYCQNYKCNWLDFSPSNYPQNCPGDRQFRISDGDIGEAEFQRRTAIARQVGMYEPYNRIWRLDAMKVKGLTAEALGMLMNEINGWSTKNDLALCKMVNYQPGRDPRAPEQKRLALDIGRRNPGNGSSADTPKKR
jgi:hypothetical protein